MTAIRGLIFWLMVFGVWLFFLPIYQVLRFLTKLLLKKDPIAFPPFRSPFEPIGRMHRGSCWNPLCNCVLPRYNRNLLHVTFPLASISLASTNQPQDSHSSQLQPSSAFSCSPVPILITNSTQRKYLICFRIETYHKNTSTKIV